MIGPIMHRPGGSSRRVTVAEALRIVTAPDPYPVGTAGKPTSTGIDPEGIAQEYRDGLSLYAIGRRHHVGRERLMRILAVQGIVPTPRPTGEVSPQQVAAILALRPVVARTIEIGRRVGVSTETVRRVLDEHGMGGRWGTARRREVEIKARLRQGGSYAEIAAEMGICTTHLRKIARRWATKGEI